MTMWYNCETDCSSTSFDDHDLSTVNVVGITNNGDHMLILEVEFFGRCRLGYGLRNVLRGGCVNRVEQYIRLTDTHLDKITEGCAFKLDGVEMDFVQGELVRVMHTGPNDRVTTIRFPIEWFDEVRREIRNTLSDCRMMGSYTFATDNTVKVVPSCVRTVMVTAFLHYTYDATRKLRGLAKACLLDPINDAGDLKKEAEFVMRLIMKTTDVDVNRFLRYSGCSVRFDESFRVLLQSSTSLAEKVVHDEPTPSMIYFIHLLECYKYSNHESTYTFTIDESALGLLARVGFECGK